MKYITGGVCIKYTAGVVFIITVDTNTSAVSSIYCIGRDVESEIKISTSQRTEKLL